MTGMLSGTSAVVTGADGPAGRAVALALAAAGSRLVVGPTGAAPGDGREPQRSIEGLAGEIRQRGGEALACHETADRPENTGALVRRCLDGFGRIDILVSAADLGHRGSLAELAEDDWQRVIAVNHKALFHALRAAVPAMKEQTYGRIITVAGDAGLPGSPGSTLYAATGAAAAYLTRTVAQEVGACGITVNCLMPAASLLESDHEAAGENPSTLSTLEALAVYLGSHEAWDVNGQIFRVGAGTIERLQPDRPVRRLIRPDRWTIPDLEAQVPEVFFRG